MFFNLSKIYSLNYNTMLEYINGGKNMTKYKTLIFDLDDTLIDNNESIKYAFSIILKYLNIPFNNQLFEAWKKFDNSYWHIWESGKMFIPDYIKTLKDKIIYLRANRFILFFNQIQLEFDKAIFINELYTKMLSVNIIEIKNAHLVIQELYNNYNILIATNGPQKAALEKTKKINIDSYISYVISSEEVGFSKPMPEFFDFLFTKFQNIDKKKSLLIGDYLTTDILGGMNNNLDTCWFNPNKLNLPNEYNPTMTINNLLELKRKL